MFSSLHHKCGSSQLAQVIQTWWRDLSEKINPLQASFLDFFLSQGRFLTSYGSKGHGGEICLLRFLCVTLWGATLLNGLYREAPPKRVTFFRRQVYKRVGISLFEVMKG